MWTLTFVSIVRSVRFSMTKLQSSFPNLRAIKNRSFGQKNHHPWGCYLISRISRRYSKVLGHQRAPPVKVSTIRWLCSRICLLESVCQNHSKLFCKITLLSGRMICRREVWKLDKSRILLLSEPRTISNGGKTSAILVIKLLTSLDRPMIADVSSRRSKE